MAKTENWEKAKNASSWDESEVKADAKVNEISDDDLNAVSGGVRFAENQMKKNKNTSN